MLNFASMSGYGLLDDGGDHALLRPHHPHPLDESAPVALDGEEQERDGDEGEQGELRAHPQHHDEHPDQDEERRPDLDDGVDEQATDLFDVARHARDGVAGSLLAVVVEPEVVDPLV
jgi:hypothetical protein